MAEQEIRLDNSIAIILGSINKQSGEEIKKYVNETEKAYKEQSKRIKNQIKNKYKEKIEYEIRKLKSEKYREFLVTSAKLLRDVSEKSAVLYIRHEDEIYKTDIETVFKNATFEYDDSIKLGGIKALFRDADIFADDTLDARLDTEMKNFAKICGLGRKDAAENLEK